MDAKDLRIETALGERNDGSKYSQSGVALQCNRNKSYQDIGSNPLARAEVAVRPCAVIGPDRVVPPPASNDAYLKKAVDLWPCSEYPPKPLNNVNPSRNISPRQTFQENMQRIMVPPTYSAVKHAEEPNLNHVHERNAALSKNSKQTMAPEAKYCDVPSYTVNLLTNEHKNVREGEMCAPSVNSPLTRGAPHGWPPNGATLHAPPRAYGPHDVYQYPQYPSCAGPRPSAIPMARAHRTFQEEGSYVYPDSYYQDASVRFKPYPSVKERYPQARYDYISSYPSPFHPPPPYAPHKYDIPNARPQQPYPVYSQMKYLENRVPDPNIEGYQRPNQQTINNYNMQFRNQIIHPPFAPVLGNTQNKLPSYPQDKSANKLSLDPSKAYIDYENAKAKYSLPDNYFVSEMARVHQAQKQVALPNYASPGMQPVSLPQYHRKDHMTIKNYEYMPHYRHFEHPLGFNHSGHHPPQFSPSTLAISPTDSNTSNDTANTQGTSQEDCGYVSQSSTTSARSVDRLHNDYHRRYDYRYRHIIGNSQMLPKPDATSSNSKENNKIDVRQFLSMWNEDEDNTNSNTKETTIPNNYKSQESTKSQDQLYVLGLVNVSSEELAKYEHIQKVSKLPENIKGYNSIELLNQFEEVIESSNINSFKTSTTKEFMPMKDRRNAIKQIVEVLPRPVSPLDVESKISQSVIHKEVGCNFEIKPCSPQMLNVEIAAPVQNILGERAIEKVSNPHSNKAKSPLSMRIDGNTACNKTQRQDSTHPTYENLSCKMIGSSFSAKRMESVKTNYILQDLETSSGVCLASLPRLDNEIELNFPEVNQQFINANKVSHNLIENYPEEVKENSEKISSITDSNEGHNNSTNQTNLSDDTIKEHTKLSKFRITKLNSVEYSEDESNANAIRTDSVIIENPENVRKNEDNKETSLHRSYGEEKNTPMNLTSENSSHLDSESRPVAECALDFSLNKSENGLPLLNTCDDELINTTQKDILMDNVASYDANNYALECASSPLKSSCERASVEPNTNSIIVRNNQSTTTDYTFNLTDDSTNLIEENHTSPQILDKSCINKNVAKITSANDHNTSMQFDYEKTSVAKATSTNVIVKHRHKIKSKSSKTRNHVIQCNLADEPITKKAKDSSFFDKKLNKNPDYDSNGSKQNLNIAKSVIQSSGVPGDHFIESIAPDNFKDENSETYSDNNITSENRIVEKNDKKFQEHISFGVSVNKERVDDCSKINSKDANSEDDKIRKNILIDIEGEKEKKPGMNGDKYEDFESVSDINELNKHCDSLITPSEISTNKTKSDGAFEESPSSFLNRVNTSDNAMKLDNISTDTDISTSQQQSKTKNIVDNNTNDRVLENVILEPDTEASTMKQNDEYHNSAVSESQQEYKQCSIVNNKLNSNSFDSEMLNTFTDEKFGCEKAMDNLPSDETIVADVRNTTAEISNARKQHNADAKLNVDKKYRIDSGYQSNKSSFNENDESIFVFPGKQTEDSVFMEQESGNDQIKSNKNIEIDNNSVNEPLSFLPTKSTSTNDSVEVVKTFIHENKNYENSNKPKLKIENIALDDIDANMEIIFAQPSKEKLFEGVNKHNTNNMNLDLETDVGSNAREKMETDICVFDVESKDTVTSNSLEKQSTEFIGDESKENLKKYCCHGKELHSPWIQKLLIFNEGKINTQIFEQMNRSNMLQETEVESPMHNKDVDVQFDNCMQNVDDKNPLANTSMHNVIVSKNVQSPFDVNIISIDDAKSPENANIENDDKDVAKLNDSIIESAETDLHNEDIEKIEVEIKNNDEVIETNGNVDKSLVISNIDVDTKNYNIDEKSLIIQTTTLKNDDELLKFPQERILTDIERVAKNKNVDNKSFEIPNIDNVLISKDVEINSFDMQMVDNIKKIDTCNDSNLKESESVQETILNVDIEFEKSSEANTNTFNCPTVELSPNISMDCSEEIGVNSDQDNKEIDEIHEEQGSTHGDSKAEFADNCVKDNVIDSHEISFSYPNHSVISQITEDTFQKTDRISEFNRENDDKDDLMFKNINDHFSTVNHLRPLKRSFSDSALNGDANERLNESHYSWAPKRNRISELENYSLNNRRSSINVEENVSFCILIDDNCIITEENEEKICIAELQEEYITEIDTGNNDAISNSDELVNELDSRTPETGVDYLETVVLECENENPVQDTWVDDIACAEEVFSDEVAENVVISAPSSPTDSALEYDNDDIDIYSNTTCSHTNNVKLIHEEKITEDDAQIVDTLYMTPHMNTMNKTLLYGDKTVESDNDQENIIIESDDWKPSPTHTPDYIDPTNVSSDFNLETPENKENVFVKDLSPLRRIDDYLDSSSAENDTDDHIISHDAPILDKSPRDETVYSSESSLDDVFDYKLKDATISTTTPSSSSSSPEVSSTTSEEKNSGILLKITNLNGSRVSQINEIQINNRPRCKFTEKKGYSTSDLNFPNRPLMTKAAQKYIPPIKESIRDLKVKITLPQQSLLKFKQLKLSRNEPKVHKQQSTIPRILKKPKPNFDDVLKSIDEIQIKRHKEKSKKNKSVVPKVLIKKNENGSHYASTPNKDTFSPDLTGRKWQPWVFLEKNHFIDKMAVKNNTKAIFSHRKKTYVLAEKFKKYKSVNSAKFVISQPKTPGQLKYTIRLKHSI